MFDHIQALPECLRWSLTIVREKMSSNLAEPENKSIGLPKLVVFKEHICISFVTP